MSRLFPRSVLLLGVLLGGQLLAACETEPSEPDARTVPIIHKLDPTTTASASSTSDRVIDPA